MFLDKRIGILCVQSNNIFFETQTKYREFDSELKHFWYDVYRTDRRRAAAAVSQVVACKDLDAGEEEAGGGRGGDVGRVGVVGGVDGSEGVGVAVAVDRPRTSPFFVRFFSTTKSRVGVYIVATANVACLLLDVIYQSRDPRHNGLVHRRQRHTNKVTCASILDEQYTIFLHNFDTFYIFYYSLTTHIMIKSKKFFAQKVVLFFEI